ncbi:hypothetical protein [Streptomyces sp. NPDC002785]|uniref:hypothetical protein n=1 Tax=Streptomyces sp. NPDC002785 TaxID=3154543 RepID=UPI0033345741
MIRIGLPSASGWNAILVQGSASRVPGRGGSRANGCHPPTVVCVLCSVLSTLTGGPSSATLGPFFALYAVAFPAKAAYSDVATKQYRTAQGPRLHRGKNQRAWPTLEVLTTVFMFGMAPTCIFSTIQANTSEATTLVTASAVLGSALLLTVIAGTQAAPHWAAST